MRPRSVYRAGRDADNVYENGTDRDQTRLGTRFAGSEDRMMSLVRLLGFTTLACGCVIGKYREVATSREIGYVEEKGQTCGSHGHRRNHTVSVERLATVSPLVFAKKAS